MQVKNNLVSVSSRSYILSYNGKLCLYVTGLTVGFRLLSELYSLLLKELEKYNFYYYTDGFRLLSELYSLLLTFTWIYL